MRTGSIVSANASAARPSSSSSAAAQRSTSRRGRLGALAPHATLARGYAIVRAHGAVLREASTVSSGDAIDVELAAGRLAARVDEVRP